MRGLRATVESAGRNRQKELIIGRERDSRPCPRGSGLPGVEADPGEVCSAQVCRMFGSW